MPRFLPVREVTTVANVPTLLLEAADPGDPRCGLLLQVQSGVAGKVYFDVQRQVTLTGIQVAAGDAPLMDNPPNVHQGEWWFIADTAGLVVAVAEQVTS